MGAVVPGGGFALERPVMPAPFYLQHLWIPLAIFAVLSALLVGLHGDFWVADRVYALEGHAWNLRNGVVTQDLLHAAGREASRILWFVLLMMAAVSRVVPQGRPWRRPLAYLLLATALSTAAVGVLKHWTNMDCPWDLLRYGGDHAYYGLFAHRPATLGQGRCFPAGHASAGYAWVALYFFFLRTRPRWRWWGLAFALGAGALFGFAQQLRGAHFLSHDLCTLAVCWLIALALARLMLAGRSTGASPGVAP
jgi:membrane-associated PAP2 superfamily phosphatase